MRFNESKSQIWGPDPCFWLKSEEKHSQFEKQVKIYTERKFIEILLSKAKENDTVSLVQFTQQIIPG
jgi:hypothetical protein